MIDQHQLAGEPAVPPGPASPRPGVGKPSGLSAKLLVTVVQTYQVVRANRPSPCRFTPTCSQYAVEAISRHGTQRGLRLAVRRLGRCRPGGPFGADPVPE